MAVRDQSSHSALSALVIALVLLGGCGVGGKSSPDAPPPASVSEPLPEPTSEPQPTSPPTEQASTTSEESFIGEESPAAVVVSETNPQPDLTLSSTGTDKAIESPETEASSESEQEELELGKDSTITVINSGEDDDGSRNVSLVEAAAAERDRRGTAPPTGIVITDKNLSTYAVGQLTVAEERAATAESTATSAHDEELKAEEAYWRDRVLEIRLAWRDAADRVEGLEGDVFHLRQRFYAEDDGFYRDSQIKPAWDRAVEQLRDAEREIVEKQDELEVALAEGRTAGALPGWLREGIDLEPKPLEEKDDVFIDPEGHLAEPGEPAVVKEDN